MDLRKRKANDATTHAAAPSDDDSSPDALDAHEPVSIGGKRVKLDEENVKEVLIRKQVKRAKEQLSFFRATLHERLLRAKQQIDSCQEGKKADWMTDIQAHLDEAISMTVVTSNNEADLDEASAIMGNADNIQADTPDDSEDSYESDLEPVPDLTKADIEAAIEESRWLHSHPEINNALDEEIVKPIFHNLFFPAIFLNKHRSSSAVKAGGVDNERTLEFDAFGDNLDEVVVPDMNGNGQGVRSVTDKGLGDTWEFSQKLTDFAVQLVNTDAKMLGENIECTSLTSIPLEINARDRSHELLTRPESRGVVHDCFHRFQRDPDLGSVEAITGSPGIGKSWTLFYALQQALLYDGATVLFFFQKSNDAVMYLRRENKMYAWTSKSALEADSNLFKRSDVLVLLDPKEAKQGGANFTLGKAKLLYAASNNEDHFKGAAGKNNGKMKAYLGPPLVSELHVILKHLNAKLLTEIIEKRRKEVGNLIRYILDVEKFEERKEATEEAVNECVKDTKKLEKALSDKGMSATGNTIPGTLFQVLPRRPEANDPNDSGTIGYDGLNVLYRERVVNVINENVRQAIVKAGREFILSYWGRVYGDEYVKMGREAEILFIKDLENANGMIMKRYLQKYGKKEAEESMVESELVVEPGEKTMVHVEIQDMRKLCSEVLKQTNVVAKVARNFALIDTAGPGRRVYQVTVSENHGMSFKAMKDICKELGYFGQKGRVVKNAKALEFYWVIPEGIAKRWKGKRPHKFQACKQHNKEDTDLVNRAMERYVIQYTLPMTYESPITRSDQET